MSTAISPSRSSWGLSSAEPLKLVQNPPGFPTFTVAWLCARLSGGRLMVDWHNYGYTILALKLGRDHWMVRIYEWYERRAGRLGDAHLCVSAALREDLARRWQLRGGR